MTAHGDLALLGERQVAKLPLPRFGEADEVAHAVAWLASDEAGYITGQALFIDGGMVRA
ncbi:SDR family oxidoreductase [Thermocatellispora tengchongensis]